MRTIVVTGGRTYSDAARVAEVLGVVWMRAAMGHPAGSEDPPVIIRHGDATGADRLAKDWCEENGVPDDPFPVVMSEWRTYGKSAGPIRNARMLAEPPTPDLVVAFPGGTGTADCVTQARALGIPVLVVPAKA
jgi:hypothetical protein